MEYSPLSRGKLQIQKKCKQHWVFEILYLTEISNQVLKQNAEFATVFPMTTEEEKRLFALLKKAYIDARYNRNYKIEKAELEYLGSRVALLKDLTERICRERIAGFIDKDSTL